MWPAGHANNLPSPIPNIYDVDPNVFTRKRPEYDPPGMRVGGFIFYPSISGGLGYTDNVFNDQSELDDLVWETEPRLLIESNWNRHSLKFLGVLKDFRHFDFSSEDRTDATAKLDARVDISRLTSVSLSARYLEVHEERGTDDLIGGLNPGDPAEPTKRTTAGAGVALKQDFNWLRLTAGADFDSITYDNTPVVGGGPDINNQDRNRDITTAFISASYEFAPRYSVFARFKWNEHDFETAVDDSGFNHDSNGWAVDAGLLLLDSQVLTGEVYASYFQQEFDDPAFGSSNGPGFGAKVSWFPSMLTTVVIDASRRVEDTSVAGSSSYVATTVDLRASHELLRNVIVTARIGAEQQDYQSLDREDRILFAGLGAKYLLSQNFELNAEWRFLDRTSDVPAVEFETNRASIALVLKF